MATPAQLIPQIEGMVGYQIGSADGGNIQGNQTVATWVQLVKTLLYTPSFRYLDDLQFKLLADVDDDASSGEHLITDATHFIGCLCEMTSTVTDDSGWIAFVDADTLTLNLGAALVDTTFLILPLRDVTTTGVSVFTPCLVWAGAADTATPSESGITMASGISVAAEGNTAGALAADALRIWILYRT